MAFKGVPVEGWTLANQDGTNMALPMTQRYLAWPNMATSREATIPKLAPAPTKFPAHLQPLMRRKAAENATSFSIYDCPILLPKKKNYLSYKCWELLLCNI